jgi:hypothetical protein
MAGFNFSPITVTPPQQNSLSDLMNIAKGAQAYQQAQQLNPLQLQQQQAQTELAQTQSKKAKALLNAEIAKGFAESETAGNTAALKRMELADTQAQKIANGQISLINDPLVIKAEKNPQSLTPDEKENLVKLVQKNAKLQATNAGIDDPQRVEELSRPYLETAQNTPEQLRSLAISRHIAGLNSAADIKSALTPSGIAVTYGSGGQTTSTNPLAGIPIGAPIPGTQYTQGLAPTIVTTPTQAPGIMQSKGGISNGANQIVAPVPNQNVNTPSTVAPQAPNLNTQFNAKGGLQIAPGETYDAFRARSARLSALPTESNKSLSMANPDSITNQELTNNRILKLLEKPNVNIGPIAKAIADKTGGVGLNTEQMEVMKYLEQRIRNESARSNQDQASQRSAYGSFGTDKEALKDIIYNDKGLLASQRLYHLGVLNAQGNPNKPNLSSVNDFETRFNQLNQDPNVSHLLGIVGNKTGEQLTQSDKKHLQKMFGGMSEKQIKELFAKKDELLSLSGVK